MSIKIIEVSTEQVDGAKGIGDLLAKIMEGVKTSAENDNTSDSETRDCGNPECGKIKPRVPLSDAECEALDVSIREELETYSTVLAYHLTPEFDALSAPVQQAMAIYSSLIGKTLVIMERVRWWAKREDSDKQGYATGRAGMLDAIATLGAALSLYRALELGAPDAPDALCDAWAVMAANATTSTAKKANSLIDANAAFGAGGYPDHIPSGYESVTLANKEAADKLDAVLDALNLRNVPGF